MENLRNKIQELRNYNIYADNPSIIKNRCESAIENKNVWKRPLRYLSFPYIELDDISDDTCLNYKSLTLNRILTALYEQDFLYLPEQSDNIVQELKSAYTESLRNISPAIIPKLEKIIFGYLENDITIDGEWNEESFKKYFESKCQISTDEESTLDLINRSDDRQLMCKTLLIQHAVDFLPESSHMARYIKGDFGEEQSALFRVMIDEFGYGKHGAKHSSMFKKTLKSVGMYDNSHAYWNFYLTSSLLNNNYFHMITTKPERFFEYVGAITYAENTFGPYCEKVRKLLDNCFDNVDSRYYLEHAHVDDFHGRMTLNEVLLPLARKYGSCVYPEFIKGIEMSSRLQKIMEDDIKKQIIWMNKKDFYLKTANEIKESVLADINNIPVAHIKEPLGELSVPHVHDVDEFCIVDEGSLRFYHGYDCYTDLKKGECIIIEKNRMHGALVLSDTCNYRIISVGDYRKYATNNI